MQILVILFWVSSFMLLYSFTVHHFIAGRRLLFTPLLPGLIFLSNIPLVLSQHVYLLTMAIQLWFYAAAFAGYVLVANKKVKFKPLFAPYNFCVLNCLMAIELIDMLKGSDQQALVLDKTNVPEISLMKQCA